jgi:hypothetical protein
VCNRCSETGSTPASVRRRRSCDTRAGCPAIWKSWIPSANTSTLS